VHFFAAEVATGR
jgi:hypothetical protein